MYICMYMYVCLYMCVCVYAQNFISFVPILGFGYATMRAGILRHSFSVCTRVCTRTRERAHTSAHTCTRAQYTYTRMRTNTHL